MSFATGWTGGPPASNAQLGFAYGQTWQAVTRTSGVTYYNTTGKPITLWESIDPSSTTTVFVNGLNIIGSAAITAAAGMRVSNVTVIPVGASYSHTTTGTVVCFELR